MSIGSFHNLFSYYSLPEYDAIIRCEDIPSSSAPFLQHSFVWPEIRSDI